MYLVHSRVQHGVGQGSFHSACVEWHGRRGALWRYDYVYDCGALVGSKPTQALKRSIKRLDLTTRDDCPGSLVIDALVLSHLDCDHLNGADYLARKFHLRRVFMPYLGADELMLVLASQAEHVNDSQVQQLHALATGTGATLFGVPVTQIMPNDNGPATPALQATDPGQPRGPQINDRASAQADGGRSSGDPPESAAATVQDTGAAVGPRLPGHLPLHVGLPDQATAANSNWQLKFWNRGVDDDLLALVFDALVSCHFPLHALHDAAAVAELTEWLAVEANREAALAAYRQAIQAHKPAWLRETSGDRLANFLSLGLYSGPAVTRRHSSCHYACNEWDGSPHFRRTWEPWAAYKLVPNGRAGWLGTGDAPLGEAQTWADFSRHFAQVLPQTLTVQVPHHGAAPKGGPRFFNPLLIAEPGMNAVISVGTKNTHGHPTTQVLKDVLTARANLAIVTEESWLGFQEVLDFYS